MIKDNEGGLLLCDSGESLQEKMMAARRMKLK